MSAERVPRRAAERLVRVGLTGVHLAVGAVGGWLGGAAVLFSALITCRIVGIVPKIGDLAAIGVMIMWAVLSVISACVVYNRRIRRVAAFIGFSFATVAFAFFAIVLVIPFGASMRGFD